MARRNRTQRRRQNAGQYGTPAQLLDSRLALRVEEGRIAPATRTVNGTTRYTDPLQSGDTRQLLPKYAVTLNGSTEYATAAYVRAAHTAATVMVSLNDLGSAAGDTWVAVGGTAGGIDVVWTSDGFDVVVSTDASNYTTYQYNGGALSGWNHIAVTVSGTTVVVFLNGVAVTTADADTGTGFDGTIPATERIRIGADAADTAANHSNASFDDFRYFDTALAAALVADAAALAPGSQRGANVATPNVHYKCEDVVTSSTLRDSGSDGVDATIATAAIATVRGTVSPVYSFANSVGYTAGDGTNGGAIGEAIPRDESDITKDIAGNGLQYVGIAPRDMPLSVPCVTLNGTNEYVQIPGQSFADLQAVPWEISFGVEDSDKSIVDMFVSFGNGSSNNPYLTIEKDAAGTGHVRIRMNNAASVNVLTMEGVTDVCDGSPHSVRVVHDGSNVVTLYVDGYVDAAGTITPASTVNTDNITFGALKRLSFSNYSPSKLWGVGITVDGTTVGNYPLTEGAGDVAHDVSGNGNDGTITGTLANIWANQTNVPGSGGLVESGYSVGTWFDGTNDYFSRANLLGGFGKFCIAGTIRLDTLPTVRIIASEYDGSTNQAGWQVVVDSGGELYISVSPTGAGAAAVSHTTTTSPITAGQLHDFSIIYDGPGSVCVIEVDGVVQASSGSIAASGFANTANFEIGARDDASKFPFAGTISQLLIHKDPTVAWDAATKAAIRAAGKTSEIAAIVSGLGGTAWYFPDGKTETLQNLPALSVNGAPEQRVVPAGTGLPPISYGPGVLPPGCSLDLYCGEDDAPFSQALAGDLSDGDYDFGDGDEGDALFRKGDANGEEIAVINPAATGVELAALNNWST